MTKRFSQSTQQSPNPGPMAASSSLQDVQPVQSAMVCAMSTLSVPCVPWLLLIAFLQDLTTSTVELNVEQSSDTGIAEVASTDKVWNILICLFWQCADVYPQGEYLDPKIVNEKITHATKNLAGIGQVPAIIQCTSSVANNLQSVSGTVNTFSVLLRPLKVFNTVANEITNVQPYISLLYVTNIHMQVHLYMKVALSIFTCASKVGFCLNHRCPGLMKLC